MPNPIRSAGNPVGREKQPFGRDTGVLHLSEGISSDRREAMPPASLVSVELKIGFISASTSSCSISF